MRFLIIIFTLSLAASLSAQSRRVAPDAAANVPAAAEVTVKQMFDEANGYMRTKAAEYDAKKVEFSTRLFNQTKLEQRQMAAKYAAAASQRKDLADDDQYYLGMLNWLAENLDGAGEALTKFIALDNADPARRQTARSVAIVIRAKQNKLDEAESVLADYTKNGPAKLTEQSRIGSEMAKAYQARKDFQKMAPHAEASYQATKSLLAAAASRARGLDEILDAGMLVYEAFRDAGERKKAEDALEDMRATAAVIDSPSFYYYAVDQKIKYLIETERKPAALAYYASVLSAADKDFRVKTASRDVISRLKKRERHYKLSGELAPELPPADAWFPGTAKPLTAYKGKVLLLDFWATWCTPCLEAFPSLIEWQQDFGPYGFEILGITRYYGAASGLPADTLSELDFLKQFRQREKLPYDFIVMKDQSAQMLFGATALPTAVLIDRKGVIRYIEAGTSSSRIGQMRNAD